MLGEDFENIVREYYLAENYEFTQATRGAARESGKLIIHLNIDDICKMLDLKDSGDDPNAVIFDIVDEMLMKLVR